MGKVCRICAANTSPSPLFNIGKKGNSFGNDIFWRKIIKKCQKMTRFFILHFVPFLNIMNMIFKNKVDLVTSHFSGCKACLEKFIFAILMIKSKMISGLFQKLTC